MGEGFWNALDNPTARTLSIGGICEDAMAGIFSGLSSFGRHVGVGFQDNGDRNATATDAVAWVHDLCEAFALPGLRHFGQAQAFATYEA